MKKEDVVLGMEVKTDDGRLGIVTCTVCDYADDAVWVKIPEYACSYWWHSESLSPAQQPSLANTKIDGYDYRAINAERIAMSPTWVQDMIGEYN